MTTRTPVPAMHSQPITHQPSEQVQAFGTVRLMPIALSHDARLYGCQRLNQLLVDSQMLHALYKRNHWHMRGATFYQLHLLMDKLAGEQFELIDMLAERIQTLGGLAVGDPRHAAELTQIPRSPDGCEEVPSMLARVCDAIELILTDAHDAADRCATLGDHGTNDLIVSSLIRLDEQQAWFVAEHLVTTPLSRV